MVNWTGIWHSVNMRKCSLSGSMFLHFLLWKREVRNVDRVRELSLSLYVGLFRSHNHHVRIINQRRADTVFHSFLYPAKYLAEWLAHNINIPQAWEYGHGCQTWAQVSAQLTNSFHTITYTFLAVFSLSPTWT